MNSIQKSNSIYRIVPTIKCAILFGFLFGFYATFGQSADTLYVQATDNLGNNLSNVTVVIGDRSAVLTDMDGRAYIPTTKKPERPKLLNAYKRGFELSSWSFSDLTVTVQLIKKDYKFVYGIVENEAGKPIAGEEVKIANSDGTAYSRKTNENGVFRLILPLDFDLNASTKFIMKKRYVSEKKFVENDTAYIALIKTRIEGVPSKADIAPTDEEIAHHIDDTVIDSLFMRSDISSSIEKLIDDIALDQQFLLKRNKSLERDISILNQKLNELNDISPERRNQISSQLTRLESLLLENEMLFKTSFKGSMSIIDKLNESIKTKENRISDIEREKEEDLKAFKIKVFIATGVTVFLCTILAFFYYLLQVLKKKKNELEIAHKMVREANLGLEEKVADRTIELRQSNKELDMFLYKSSHDLRRPLTTFLGLCNLIRAYGAENNIVEILDKIDLTAANMDRMLRKLIHIHQINNSNQRSEVGFSMLVDKIKQDYGAKLKDNDMELKLEIPAANNLTTDGEILEIILCNLIENSLAFRKKGQKTQICIDMIQDKGQSIIRVSDNGQGVSPDVLPKVFDMFYIGNTVSSGNGLGLYVVKKGVEKLNGKVKLESVHDQSTTFTIVFSNRITEDKTEEIPAVLQDS